MQAHRLLPFVFIAVFVLAGLPWPVAEAQAPTPGLDDFEDDQVFGPPSADFYTWAPTSGSTAFVSTAYALSGTQSVKHQVSQQENLFTLPGALCQFNGGIGFSFYFATMPSSAAYFGFLPDSGFTSSTSGLLAFRVANAGSVTIYENDASTVSSSMPGITVVPGQWYTAHLSQFNTIAGGDDCNTIAGQALRLAVTIVDEVTQTAYGTFVDNAHTNLDYTATQFWTFGQSSAGGASSSNEVYLDDFQINGYTPPLSSPRDSVFCSARNNEHFDYNYAEDVTRDLEGDEVGGDSGEITGLVFRGDADNLAYLAAHFDATKAAKVFFRVEARAEGVRSVFRTGFSFVDATPYVLAGEFELLNGPDDVGADAKGNGKDTESFAEWIEVRLWETGDDWDITLFYVSQSNAVTTRTVIGNAYYGGNPNTPTSYSFQVDTRPEGNYVSVTYANGQPIGNGLLNRTLPAAFANSDIRQQWFVGYASDTVFNNNAFTWLEDQSLDSSTCIYTLDADITKAGAPGSGGPTLNATGAPISIQDPNEVGDEAPGSASAAGVVPMFQQGVDGVAAVTGMPVALSAMLFGLFGMVFTVTVFAVPTFFATQHARGGSMLTVLVGVLGGVLGMVVYYAFGLLPGWVVTLCVFLLLCGGAISMAVMRR